MTIYKIAEIKDILKAYKVFKLGTNYFSAQFNIYDSTELECRKNILNNFPDAKIIHFERRIDNFELNKTGNFITFKI
jgi:hypothetical protein